MRNLLYICIISLAFSCNTKPEEKPVVEIPETSTDYTLIGGKTMGTTYSVKYNGGNPKGINAELDSLFFKINQSVSTYEKESLISRINSSKVERIDLGTNSESVAHFITNYLKAKEVNSKTEGLFDPTVMPIVNYWGFGYKDTKPINKVDEAEIKKILEYVGMDKISMMKESKTGKKQIYKKNKLTQLDFSALAKGYAVDKAAELLESKGFEDYLVEIGGEVVTKGYSPNGKEWEWVIGINTPDENAKINDFIAYVQLSGKAMATSGNYRNFYEIDGKKYSHTINPKTGFPERSNLLSATIIAPDCMSADAYATACMVGGLEKANEWIGKDNTLEGFFVFVDDKGELQTQQTPGFGKYLKK